jgi:HEAT repeat protein
VAGDAKPGPVPKPLDAAEKTRLLADLKSLDESTVRLAVDRLANSAADAARDDVAQALTPLLSSHSSLIRASAANALIKWAAPHSVSALVAAVDDTDYWVRKSAMEALGRLKTAEGAKAVAARMTNQSDRHHAARALTEMGPIAESAVVPYLKDRDEWVQQEVCKILGAVGTHPSLPALEAYARNAPAIAKLYADQAIQSIRQRKP